MPMRTWRQGLHQIIEAKEGLAVTGPSETLARLSFQAFFQKYQRLAGASGTLREAAAEIWSTYGVPFVAIPRNLPCRRSDGGVRFFSSRQNRDTALIREIKDRHERGQPLLVGTHTVESSEDLAIQLLQQGLPNVQVLNARRHREEAAVVAQAGQKGQIIIATGMAGRGTDIRLEAAVVDLGGLHVIATEVNESQRVDRQLFGRSARQGDPGSVMAFYDGEDPVLARFSTTWSQTFWRMLWRPGLTPLAQVCGRVLLRWTHWRAQHRSAWQRSGVMRAEEEIRRSLGFTTGRSALRTKE
jgi:preprotein translocase subunit SecA